MAFYLFILLISGIYISSLIDNLITINLLAIFLIQTFPVSLFIKEKNIASFLLILSWLITSIIFGYYSCHFTGKQEIIIKPKDLINISGKITSNPCFQFGHMNFYFTSEKIFTDKTSYKISDKFYVQVKNTGDFLEKGQTIKCSGKITKLNPDKTFEKYLLTQGLKGKLIVSDNLTILKSNYILNKLQELQRKISYLLYTSKVDYRTAGIFDALVFGNKISIPKDLKDIFKKTNTYHIFAVSGSHFTIIAAIFIWMLRFFGISKIWSYGLVIPILLLFLAIIDFPASACRAFVMIVLFLLASCFGRQSNAFNILGASGLILLIWYPGYAYDLGFILSFAAVIALIGPGYYCDLRFKEWLKKKEEEYAMDESFVKKLKITGKWIISPGIYSFWAWIGTAPLIAYYFKTFSAISVVSNLVAVLIMPLLLLCLILAILLGQISYIFALAYCHVADFLIKFLNWSFKIMVKIPGSSLNLNSFTKWDFLWSYALIAIFFIGIYSKTRKIQKITIKP